MTAEYPVRGLLFTGLLGLALGSCGDSGTPGGTGGATSGGSGGVGGAGGSVPSAGTGQAGQGGTPGSSGSAGQPGAAGSGTNGGSAPSAGASAGGVSGSEGPAGSSGTGVGAAGSGQTAGSGGVAGQSGSGGEAGSGGTGENGGNAGSGQAGRGGGGGGKGGASGGRSISFGTLLDAEAVISSAQQLAESLADPGSAQWQAKGDQHRTYHFPDTDSDEPYRLYVPTDWDGSTSLPLAMFLHGAGSNENTYVDQNNKQMVTLAQQHGYLLVAPLGDSGAYGNFLRLTAPFGDPAGAAELMAAVTTESERTNELSEQDVINVLELVLSEYPVDREALFLFGHSMGSGGTWYIGGKYAGYWRGIAPMSGPFVQETGYPWDAVRSLSIFVTEGTQTPSLDASKLLANWLDENEFDSQYLEVNADHGGMVPLVMPDVFEFFDASRSN
jgi:predicted esterase